MPSAGCGDHFEVWCEEHGSDVTADRNVTEHRAKQVNRSIVQHAKESAKASVSYRWTSLKSTNKTYIQV